MDILNLRISVPKASPTKNATTSSPTMIIVIASADSPVCRLAMMAKLVGKMKNRIISSNMPVTEG